MNSALSDARSGGGARPPLEALRPPRLRRAPCRAPGPGSAIGLSAALGDLPCLAKLFYRLVRDPRVSRVDKLLLASAAAYLVAPHDIIPDWIPVVGQLDDLLVIGLALHRLLDRVEPDVLLEHWDGEPDRLETLLAGLERLRGAFVTRALRPRRA